MQAAPTLQAEEHVEAWKPIVEAVHKAGSLFVAQRQSLIGDILLETSDLELSLAWGSLRRNRCRRTTGKERVRRAR
jgi:hypothetical protein